MSINSGSEVHINTGLVYDPGGAAPVGLPVPVVSQWQCQDDVVTINSRLVYDLSVTPLRSLLPGVATATQAPWLDTGNARIVKIKPAAVGMMNGQVTPEPLPKMPGEFLDNFVSRWIGELTNKKLVPILTNGDKLLLFNNGFSAPVNIASGEFLPNFVSQWIGDLSNRKLVPILTNGDKLLLFNNGFSAPANIASGEFLPNFVSQWLGDLANRKLTPLLNIADKLLLIDSGYSAPHATFAAPAATPSYVIPTAEQSFRSQFKLKKWQMHGGAFVCAIPLGDWGIEVSDQYYRPRKRALPDNILLPPQVPTATAAVYMPGVFSSLVVLEQRFAFDPRTGPVAPMVAQVVTPSTWGIEVSDQYYRRIRKVTLENALPAPQVPTVAATPAALFAGHDAVRRVNYFKKQPDDGFKAPANIASGEFLPNFVAQWLGQWEARKQRPNVTPGILSASVCPTFLFTPTTPSIAHLAPNDPGKTLRRFFVDLSASAPIGVAPGEFLSSFVSQWVGHWDVRKTKRSVPRDGEAGPILLQITTPSLYAFQDASAIIRLRQRVVVDAFSTLNLPVSSAQLGFSFVEPTYFRPVKRPLDGFAQPMFIQPPTPTSAQYGFQYHEGWHPKLRKIPVDSFVMALMLPIFYPPAEQRIVFTVAENRIASTVAENRIAVAPEI